MSEPHGQSGPHFQGINVDGQAKVHMGDTINNIQYQILHAEGLTINSKAAGKAYFTGQYSNTSLRPVKKYVPRPELHEKLKMELHERLEEDTDSRRILVVYGIGGVGKSQLVLNYVQAYRRDYTAVFWIEAGRRETIERDFLQIHRLLFDVQSHGFFVFDGADTIDNEEDKSYIDIEHFLPTDPSVHIIITTRNSAAKGMTLLEPIGVAEMKQPEAVELFLSHFKIKSVPPEMTTAVEMIVEELGYLALAVTLAGSYVSSTPRLRTDINSYLPEYRERRRHLLAQKPRRLIHQYGESVLTTWETTFAAIENQAPEASRLLTLLGFMNFDDIFMDLFEPITRSEKQRQADTEDLEDTSVSSMLWKFIVPQTKPADLYTMEAAFRVLESYSLVQWRDDQKSYSIHKLIHVWAHDRLDEEFKYVHGIVALQLLDDVTESCGPEPARKSRLVPHLMANFGIVSKIYNIRTLKDLVGQFRTASSFLYSIGRWTETCTIQKFILHIHTSHFGEEHPDTISAMSDLASTLHEQGQLQEAGEMNKEVLAARRRILGEEHPGTVSAMNNLAIILQDQGQLEEAAIIQKEVVSRMRRILGEEHPSTISAMSNLATTLYEQGQLQEAGVMNKEVLATRRRILGEEHPDTIAAMNSLAVALNGQGQLKEAASIQTEVLVKRRKILGEEHPSTISAMSNLAITLAGQGQLKEAALIQREVLMKRRKILGEEHPDTISAMGNLAAILNGQGQLEEAALIQMEVLAKRRKILSEEHPDTISAINNLAAILSGQGQLEEAALIQTEVLAKSRRILGEEHPDTITAMTNLAAMLNGQGQLEEAALIQTEVLAKTRKILGEEHPDTISAMGNLAVILNGQGQLEEAALIQREVLAKSRRILGEEHPYTIWAMSNLAGASRTKASSSRLRETSLVR